MSSPFLTQQTFSHFVIAFLDDRASKGRTSGTLDYYRDELELFFNWLNYPIEIEKITPDILRRYFIDLSARRNKGGVNCSYRAVKAFFNFYNDEYEPVWKNPIKKVKLPPQKLAPLPEIPMEDVQKLINVCDGKFKLRDIAILKCLVDTGCRASELIALNYGDIDFAKGSVMVLHGKGDKFRIVYLGLKAKKALQNYLSTRNNLTLSSPLFLNNYNKRLKFYGLREIIVRLSQRAGIEEKGLHSFRRTFALTLWRNQVDILTISRLLGHSNIEITKRYLNINNEDLKAAHNRASPADSLE